MISWQLVEKTFKDISQIFDSFEILTKHTELIFVTFRFIFLRLHKLCKPETSHTYRSCVKFIMNLRVKLRTFTLS